MQNLTFGGKFSSESAEQISCSLNNNGKSASFKV